MILELREDDLTDQAREKHTRKDALLEDDKGDYFWTYRLDMSKVSFADLKPEVQAVVIAVGSGVIYFYDNPPYSINNRRRLQVLPPRKQK